MKGKNMILLSFAVLAIGLFVLPQTMAMFVGQHTWFSVRTSVGQKELCIRCHEGEVAEWETNYAKHGAHSQYYQDTGTHCFCHQINASELNADWKLADVDQHGFIHWNESGDVLNKSTWSFRTNDTPHAALVVLCTDCHRNASAQLNNSNSAHKVFYDETLNQPDTNNNTACMACHTMVGLNITMERIKSGIEIVANHTGYTYPTWTVNASINTTNRTINSTYWAPGVKPTLPTIP